MMKVFLIVCTLWHDMVQGTIITSYCLQGQLLMSHLYFLRGKLLQHILLPIDWMRVCDSYVATILFYIWRKKWTNIKILKLTGAKSINGCAINDYPFSLYFTIEGVFSLTPCACKISQLVTDLDPTFLYYYNFQYIIPIYS